MDFIGEIFGLKFICGYLITLCSIILVLIIYKTCYASKSLVWISGVTNSLLNCLGFQSRFTSYLKKTLSTFFKSWRVTLLRSETFYAFYSFKHLLEIILIP